MSIFAAITTIINVDALLCIAKEMIETYVRMNEMYSDFLVLDVFRIETNLNNDAIKRFDGNTSAALRRTLKRAINMKKSVQLVWHARRISFPNKPPDCKCRDWIRCPFPSGKWSLPVRIWGWELEARSGARTECRRLRPGPYAGRRGACAAPPKTSARTATFCDGSSDCCTPSAYPACLTAQSTSCRLRWTQPANDGPTNRHIYSQHYTINNIQSILVTLLPSSYTWSSIRHISDVQHIRICIPSINHQLETYLNRGMKKMHANRQACQSATFG